MTTTKQYINKIKQKPKINETMKRGISTTRIQDARTAQNTEIRKAQIELLSGLVKDPQLINILIQEENMQKIKTRIETRYAFRNQKGEPLATANKIGQTPTQTTNEIKKLIKQNETIEEAHAKGTPKLETKLKQNGFQNIQIKENGTITQTTLTIILRKG